MRFSTRLREEVPDERLVIRWLEQQPGLSDAVREALIAHVKGQNGVSMLAVNDKLDRLLRLVEGGVAVGSVGETTLPAQSGPGDGLGYLDEMGL